MLACALFAWLFSSCTLTRKKAECDQTSECRAAFGTGYVCQKDGLCAPATVERKCLNHYPDGLLLAPHDYKDYIVFGSLLKAEGKEGARQDSALLALEAINEFLQDHEHEYPALDRLRFGMVQCNHMGDRREVADLAEYLVDTLQTPVILGPASSSATSEAFRRVNVGDNETELRRAVFISPSATSVALTELERQTPGFLWRTAPTDDGQGQLMGKFAADRDLSFLAVYEKTPYGEGLYNELMKASDQACDQCGLSFDASSEKVNSLASTLASNRARSALEDADVVFFMGAQEPHLEEMIERLDDEEFSGKLLFLSDAGASSDTVRSVHPANTERVLGTRAKGAEDSEAWRIFSAVYEARHEESPELHSFTANAYDAAWMVVLASLRSHLLYGEITPQRIAEGLRHLDDPKWSDRSARDCPGDYEDQQCAPLNLDSARIDDMLEGLIQWGSIDVRGASGELDYDDEREELENGAAAFEYWHLERPDADRPPTIESGPGPLEDPDGGAD